MLRETSGIAAQQRRVSVEQPTDTELLLRIQHREEAALESLYDRYGRLLYTIALRITSDRAVTEEVIQDVFCGVWQSANTFRPERSVVAWLIGITRHRAIDATRSRQYRARSRELVLDTAEDHSHIAISPEQTTESILRQTVQQALATLSPRERQVVELAYYGGLTQAEIAARLGEPLGTVKSRLRIALLKLHTVLQAIAD